jgi:hypothetical protein
MPVFDRMRPAAIPQNSRHRAAAVKYSVLLDCHKDYSQVCIAFVLPPITRSIRVRYLYGSIPFLKRHYPAGFRAPCWKRQRKFRRQTGANTARPTSSQETLWDLISQQVHFRSINYSCHLDHASMSFDGLRPSSSLLYWSPSKQSNKPEKYCAK